MCDFKIPVADLPNKRANKNKKIFLHAKWKYKAVQRWYYIYVAVISLKITRVHKRPPVSVLFWKSAAGSVVWVVKLAPGPVEQWSSGRSVRTVSVHHFRPGSCLQTRYGCLVMWAVGCGSHRCRCRPAVPSWALTGWDQQQQPPWPRRYPAAHLSDSPLRWPPSPSCSWCRWPPYSPPKATRSRFTETVWSNVSGPTAPELGYAGFSQPSRGTWRWQVSCCWQVEVRIPELVATCVHAQQ